jgi:general secretion pathway protein K
MAESGITGGIKIIQMSLSRQGYTSLQDRWAKPLEIRDEAGVVRVTIEEESGKLNLNQLVLPNGTFFEPYTGIARRLFKNEGLSLDLLEALADWIDENDEPLPGGAESSYYRKLQTPYAAKNGKLETLEELGLVKGFSGKIIEKIRPLVTVYAYGDFSSVTPININTAPQKIIAAMDEQMTEGLTKRILDYRQTRPFTHPADLAKMPGMEPLAISLQGKILVKGTVFRLRSQAKVRETTRIIEAVARVTDTQSTFLYWREF